jgi:hypothetical protein
VICNQPKVVLRELDPRIHVFLRRSKPRVATEPVRGLKAHGTSPAKLKSKGAPIFTPVKE